MSGSGDGQHGESKRQQVRPLVYNLRVIEGPGDSYFTQVASFSELVVEQVRLRTGAILDRFIIHSVNVLRAPSVSRGEAAMDLLTVGAAIALYANSARRVPGWVLTELQKLSWKCGRPALTADMLRDALSRGFMKVDYGDPREAAQWARANPEAVFDQLPHLIEWLQCTVDLAEVSRCLVNWVSMLRTLPRTEACRWIENVQELFDWFEPAANNALGRYTRGVSEFRGSRRRTSSRREDRFLGGKWPVAYHLAMVSVEIANREMRSTFARCSRKVVLLPACMRGVNAGTCPGGQSGGFEVHCSGCDSTCNVCAVTQAMMSSGAEVYVENCPRESLRPIRCWGQEPDTGVVVVACLANLKSIQLAARSAGMTCQFLPLDFPGCHAHWRTERRATGLNQEELVKLLMDTGPRGR